LLLPFVSFISRIHSHRRTQPGAISRLLPSLIMHGTSVAVAVPSLDLVSTATVLPLDSPMTPFYPRPSRFLSPPTPSFTLPSSLPGTSRARFRFECRIPGRDADYSALPNIPLAPHPRQLYILLAPSHPGAFAFVSGLGFAHSHLFPCGHSSILFLTHRIGGDGAFIPTFFFTPCFIRRDGYTSFCCCCYHCCPLRLLTGSSFHFIRRYLSIYRVTHFAAPHPQALVYSSRISTIVLCTLYIHSSCTSN